MSLEPQANGLNMVAIVGLGVLGVIAWYSYQIGSRKKNQLRHGVKQAIIALCVYFPAALLLNNQGLPPFEAVLFGGLAGMGTAWLVVSPPKKGRRIPKAIRQEVIERDLTSKGLKWDPGKHHIDHLVPFSRGGDHSAKNLRVIEKNKNLRKGGKMPGFWDFLRK
jgi:hypothetical protein